MTRRVLQSSLAVVFGAVAGVVLAATPAAAHTGHPLQGFGDGFTHPMLGPDHLLAMVAVGIVAATLRTRAWGAPATFVGGVLLGGVAGMLDVPLPGAEVLVLGSVGLLGLAIAGAVQGRGRWLFAALAVAGAAHGHAHGAEAPAVANALTYVVGLLTATVALHLSGMTVGTIIRDWRTVRLGVGLATVTGAGLLVV